MNDIESFVVCEDPDVINGDKFCFCCFPNCLYRRVVSKEEYLKYECSLIELKKANTDEKQKE